MESKYKSFKNLTISDEVFIINYTTHSLSSVKVVKVSGIELVYSGTKFKLGDTWVTIKDKLSSKSSLPHSSLYFSNHNSIMYPSDILVVDIRVIETSIRNNLYKEIESCRKVIESKTNLMVEHSSSLGRLSLDSIRLQLGLD